MNTLNLIRFITVIATAVSLGAGLAHVLSLPHKMQLGRDDYLTVQQIYFGWALVGIALVVALLGSVWLTAATWKRGAGAPWTAVAALCIAATLVVFFVVIFPVNRVTVNWTTMPANWESLRRRWEYGHAVDTGLYFIALSALTVSLLAGRGGTAG
jgi:hypothetical protein